MRLFAAIAWVLALASASAGAPGWLAASAPQSVDLAQATHAWVIAPSADGAQSILLHVPPRGAGSLGAEDGTVRMARPTGERITHAAARANELYLVAEPQTGPAGRTRPVRSVRAEPHPAVQGLWVFEPAGRLSAEAALPGEGRLAALGLTESGPVALLETDGAWSLLALREGSWEKAPLPPEGALVNGAGCALVDAAGALVLAVEHEGGVRVWVSEKPALEAEWASAGGTLEPGATRGLLFMGGSLMWPVREGERSVVWRADLDLKPPSVSGSGPLVATERPGAAAVLAGLAGSGRLLWAWGREEDSGGAFSSLTPAPIDVAEFSAYTGRLLYEGPAKSGGPITVQDFRVLAAALIGATVLVLVLVLRGDADDGAYALPEGWALAEPGRRLAGSLIDLLLVAAATSLLTQARIIDLVSLTVLIQPGGAADLGIMVTLGFVGSTLFELAAGGTPGKLLLGMRVARTGAGPARRPGPASAAVRNLVKWALPPLAAMALISPSGRHKGDVIAGAVVVVPVEPVGDAERS